MNTDKPTCIDPVRGSLLMHYAMNNLSESEREEFEEHLIACEACQDELIEHEHEFAALAEGREHIKEARPHSAAPARRRSSIWYFAAAALGLVAVLLWVNRVDNPTPDIVENIKPDSTLQVKRDSLIVRDTVTPPPIRDVSVAHLAIIRPLAFDLSTSRSPESAARKLMSRAKTDYENGHYAEADSLLQQAARLTNVQNERLEIALYSGVTAALSENYTRAVGHFLESQRRDPQPRRLSQIKWYFAQVELKRERSVSAKKLLAEVIAINGDYLQEAKAQLASLNALIGEK